MTQIREQNIKSNSCETCGHYQLKKMVTSGQPYGYSGEVPCFTCSRYSTVEDRHTNRSAL